MKKIFVNLTIILILASCSNTPDMETGEIRTLKLIKKTFSQKNDPKSFVDSRNLLSRKQIDTINVPVLFVELASGQNGTLTPYPGQGIGQTWLGADGATITLEQGILKASRGMGDDIMGSTSSIPPWSKINHKIYSYSRRISFITGNNQIFERTFECNIEKNDRKEIIEIWKVEFRITKFEETCENYNMKIKNIYYVDKEQIVRKSSQYHGKTIGYITIERLDR
ncbi:MAG: YjbF family lipoprotein [Paracoccaceae bacterium]